jgi:hypothetical protein
VNQWGWEDTKALFPCINTTWFVARFQPSTVSECYRDEQILTRPGFGRLGHEKDLVLAVASATAMRSTSNPSPATPNKTPWTRICRSGASHPSGIVTGLEMESAAPHTDR